MALCPLFLGRKMKRIPWIREFDSFKSFLLQTGFCILNLNWKIFKLNRPPKTSGISQILTKRKQKHGWKQHFMRSQEVLGYNGERAEMLCLGICWSLLGLLSKQCKEEWRGNWQQQNRRLLMIKKRWEFFQI